MGEVTLQNVVTYSFDVFFLCVTHTLISGLANHPGKIGKLENFQVHKASTYLQLVE